MNLLCERDVLNKMGWPSGQKPTNPKDSIGSTKAPLSLVPAATLAYLSIGHEEGRRKYGAWNWRVAGVRASIYLDALERHIQRWKEGEEVDPQTGVPHLASALTCLSILVDARVGGTLTDDRPPSNVGALDLIANLPKLMAGLPAPATQPRSYTIEDTLP